MTRPGFVLDVDERTQPLLVPEGTGVRLQTFGAGTRVLYPGEAVAGVAAYEQVDEALATPLGSEPLAHRLHPGMRLTITFSDISTPQPPMRHDVRRVIVERVLETAAAAGVDDVVLIAATGLRRHCTKAELAHVLGERVVRSFAGDALLRNHDAEDTSELVTFAEGHTLNRRVAESDLVVNIAVVTEQTHGGARAFASSLAGVDTIDAIVGRPAHHHPEAAQVAIAAVVGGAEVFEVEAVLGQPLVHGPMAFLSAREWEWKLRDRVGFLAARRALAAAPTQASRALFGGLEADYAVLGVSAGAMDEAAAAAQATLLADRRVEVAGQADILVAGIGHPTSQAPDSIGNPLTAAWDGLSRLYGAHTGTPAVREGGAMVLFHPLAPRFSTRHDSASADFFSEVLSRTTDPDEIAADAQLRFAGDEWFIRLYQLHHSFHPLQPFHLWYAIQPALARLSDVVVVGADRRSAETMGLRAASSYADALEVLATTQGRTPLITALHTTGGVIADVTAGR